MSKIQQAIRDSIERDEIVAVLVTPSEFEELIEVADDYNDISLEGGIIDAWKVDPTNRWKYIWRIEAYIDRIDPLAEAPLEGARIVHMDEDSVTIRPYGAGDASGDATVYVDEHNSLWLEEAGTRVRFEGSLQDIVDAWEHAGY